MERQHRHGGRQPDRESRDGLRRHCCRAHGQRRRRRWGRRWLPNHGDCYRDLGGCGYRGRAVFRGRQWRADRQYEFWRLRVMGLLGLRSDSRCAAVRARQRPRADCSIGKRERQRRSLSGQRQPHAVRRRQQPQRRAQARWGLLIRVLVGRELRAGRGRLRTLSRDANDRQTRQRGLRRGRLLWPF